MNDHSLTPTLEHIERDLFGPSEQLLQCWAETPDKVPADLRASLEKDDAAILMRDSFLDRGVDEIETKSAETTEVSDASMPAFLQDTIKRQKAVDNTNYGRKPQTGQIVSVVRIDGPHGSLGWDLPRPHAMLLSEPTEHPDIWYGWLVAPETLYASEWDFVIQDDDGIVSPFVGVVQMWNPVHVYLKNTGAVIGRLNDDAMHAVRMLGVHMITNNPLPALGQAGAWVMRQIDDYVIVTGCDIVEDNDPRIIYQQLYVNAAVAVKEPARLVAAEPSPFASFLTSLQEQFMSIGDILVPQPRVAMAMGETEEKGDTIYSLGSFPLQMHLIDEMDEFFEIIILHQAEEQQDAEACIVRVLDDSGMPFLDVTVDVANPKVNVRIPVSEKFSLYIEGRKSHTSFRWDSEALKDA